MSTRILTSTGDMTTTSRSVRLQRPIACLLGLTVSLLASLLLTAPLALAEGLPDGRVYELVSPIENENSEVYVPLAVPTGILGDGQGVTTQEGFGSSVDGDTVEYIGDSVAGGDGFGSGAGEGEPFVARRLPGSG